MIRIGIAGYGYWGPKLFRNFQTSPHFDVVGVADRSEEVRTRLRASFPNLAVYGDAMELVESGCCDAIAVATPVATHYAIASRALDAGLHVWVEKPMTATVAEAEDLVARARRADRVLLVDHVFLFCGAVRTIKRLMESGTLGRVTYVDSVRVNLGLFQNDVNVLWDLGPHDLSIIDFLFEEEPLHVDATGYCHADPAHPDMCYVTFHYPSSRIAHLSLSWMSPVKVRRFVVAGDEAMLVWDDLNREEKVKIYRSGIRFQPAEERDLLIPEYRIGDIFSPRVPNTEPLSALTDHFARRIAGEGTGEVDGERALRIVRLLERTDRALHAYLSEVAARGREPV